MIAAAVLAAGASRRMGQTKQLIEYQGEALAHRTVRMALEAGCEPVVVVLGSDAEAVARALSDLPTELVMNSDWAEGMASSIRTGLNALPKGCTGVLLLTCDQPAVDAGHLRKMILAHGEATHRIIASAYAGVTGVPALFPRASFEALKGLSGDQGARGLLHDPGVLALELPGGELDFDRPGDLPRDSKN